MPPPSLETRVGGFFLYKGPLAHSQHYHTPPSLETRVGGVFSPFLSTTLSPPSLETRDGGAFSALPTPTTCGANQPKQ